MFGLISVLQAVSYLYDLVTPSQLTAAERWQASWTPRSLAGKYERSIGAWSIKSMRCCLR